jgi:predicted dehydrogenase
MARNNVSRRDFVKTSAALGAGFWVAGGVMAKESNSPNEKIQFASVGVDGKGKEDSNDAFKSGAMVAICDVDDEKLGAAASKFKDAKKFNDFRKMHDEMGDKIDAVTVSTPDHNHAAVSLLFMRSGKHCFCQKPLTHTIYEADLMGKVAAQMNVATQMGNQGTAGPTLRKAAAVIRAGAVGPVKEVHVWTNRPIWDQGKGRPAPKAPPKNLHWDLWLGTAKERPYGDGYHPFSWRGFWDFGTGSLGDMACHTVNMPFMALDLFDPTSVEAQSSYNNKEMYPEWSIIKFEFPKNDTRPGLTLTWYDKMKQPPPEVHPPRELAKARFHKNDPKYDGSIDKSGVIIVGELGSLYAPGDYCENGHMLTGKAQEPTVQFVESPGHFKEWVRAIKTGNKEPAMSNFPTYASRLTKTILLGNLAVWAGTKVEWDPVALKSTNLPELEAVVHPTYREGYVLEGKTA